MKRGLEKSGKPVVAGKAVQTPFEKLQVGRSVRRFLAYSPEFRSFARKYPGALSAVFKTIQEHLPKLRSGNGTIHVNGFPIEITPDFAGTGKGEMHLAKFRVRVGPKSFFVKMIDSQHDLHHYPKSSLKRFRAVEEYLAEKKYHISGFNVHALRPHFAYSNAGIGFWVTDFIENKKIQIPRFIEDGALCLQISGILNIIENGVWKKSGEKIGIDAAMRNAFFIPATKTILIFDV